MINFSGPRFKDVDNRLMSLELVRNEMTDAVMFGPDGNNLLAAAILYKKNILALRGSFRPVTKVNMDMFQKSLNMFVNDQRVDPDNTKVIFEITLSNLKSSNEEEEEVNEKDFMDRAELLCSLGHTVMISNFQQYYKVVDYFSKYTSKRMGLSMGVNNMVDLFDAKYYTDLPGGILEAFGKFASSDVKVYLYPFMSEEDGLITSDNLKVHPRMKELYKFFKYNGKVSDIEDYDPSVLGIFSRDVLRMIENGEHGWEDMLPGGIAELIKKHHLFGYKQNLLVE